MHKVFLPVVHPTEKNSQVHLQIGLGVAQVPAVGLREKASLRVFYVWKFLVYQPKWSVTYFSLC